MEDESEPNYQAETRPKMSLTPSWIMLGFVLGALFVAALPSFEKEVPPPALPLVRSPEPTTPKLGQITTIEAVFAAWGEHAVWSDDVTEVSLWSTETNRYDDSYEVRRVGDRYYFRSLPRLTRRVIKRGKPVPECPLLFTETEEQYREWLEHGRSERRPTPADR